MLNLLFVVLKPYVSENDHYDNLKIIWPCMHANNGPHQNVSVINSWTVVAAQIMWRSDCADLKSARHIGFVPYFGAVGTPVRPRRCGRK